jgi:hypothetical protein
MSSRHYSAADGDPRQPDCDGVTHHGQPVERGSYTTTHLWLSDRETDIATGRPYRTKAQCEWWYRQFRDFYALPVGVYEVHSELGTLMDRFRIWNGGLGR